MSEQPHLPRLPERKPESHKGTFGTVLCVGGSRGMGGAIGLTGMAALRGGAGLVKIATAAAVLETVAGYEPSYMTMPLPCDNEGRINLAAKEPLEKLASAATCLACGPGLGKSDELTQLIGWMYASLDTPIVFDADALNALAVRPDGLPSPRGPRVLTPHPGEFRRLAGEEKLGPDQWNDRTVTLADQWGVVLVLKTHQTLVTDGRRRWLNSTGNPGMATGGAGDVLTGLIASFFAQGMPPFEAAQLAVHTHTASPATSPRLSWDRRE